MKLMTVLLAGTLMFATLNSGSTVHACGPAQGCPDGSELAIATPLTSIVTFGSSGVGGIGGYYLKESGTISQQSIDWTHSFSFDPAAFSISKALLTLNYHDDARYDCTEKAEFDEHNFGLPDDEFTLMFQNGLNGSKGFNLHINKTTDHLHFKLEAEEGDFYLDSSTLYIEYQYCADNSDPAPVPEPGTLMLLGIGMVGMALYGKRRMKRE